MEMPSEDVEGFDLYGDTVGIVNAYDMFMGATKEGKVRPIHGRTTLAFIKQSGQW